MTSFDYITDEQLMAIAQDDWDTLERLCFLATLQLNISHKDVIN
jgi:hypothetical protein